MNGPSDPAELPDFLEARRRGLVHDLCFDGAFGDWRARVLALWREGLPPCAGLPEGVVSGDAVTLTYATGARAEGVLLRPAGPGPHPAVLLLHDHGGDFAPGWRKMVEPPAPGTPRHRHYHGLAPAEVFLKAGFAVLCLDALGWGGRQAGGYEGQQALAANAAGLGWSLAGITAAEDVQAAAWLAAQPGIDAGRVGAFGFSFGGFRAWQVAALSPVVMAAASVGWMAERAALMRPGAPLLRGQSAFHFLHPALAGRVDFPDMAGLAAGKALIFRSGLGDPHMPEDGVRSAWERVSVICAAAGGPLPDTGFHDHGHTCPPEVLQGAADFLRKSLA